MSVSDGVDLVGTLATLEQTRQENDSKVKRWIVVVAATAGGAALYCYLTGRIYGMWFALGLGFVVAVGASSHLHGKVRRAFKREVMPILLRGIDRSLRYEGDGCVEKGMFNQCGLYTRPDRYSGKDLVEGYVGETAVKFSLIDAEEEYEESSTDFEGNRRTETKYRTVFRGLFFVADFNKHFTGRTLVRPRAVNFLSKLHGSHVALEDPEFDRVFTVNSTDQVEARYIMTPSLMQRFKVLRSRVGAFRASFFQGHLFIAIDMPWNTFEPSTRRSFTDSGQIERISANLRSITGIVEDLALNVRLWTKLGSRPEEAGSTA